MSVTKITIHRGLTELKTLDTRINKEIDSLDACVPYNKIDGKTLNNESVEIFEADVKRRLQKTMGLISRRNIIKSAIVKANAETAVTIGSNSMSIADAINMKLVINTKLLVSQKLRKSLADANKKTDLHNAQTREHSLSMIKTVNRDITNINEVNPESKGYGIMREFVEANTLDISDPIGARILSDKLEEEVTIFTGEIDAALSYINAVTEIEVPNEN